MTVSNNVNYTCVFSLNKSILTLTALKSDMNKGKCSLVPIIVLFKEV